MKGFIIKCISIILQTISRVAVRFGISRPKVVIYMDGGICSQMSMYLRGQYFKDVAEVLYDTTWFELNGKDLDGRFDRKLELREFFPTLEFKTISCKQRRFYKLFYSYPHNNGYLPEPKTIKKTTYFGGYFDMKPEDIKELFNCCYNAENMRVPDVHLPVDLTLGSQCTKVAMHVRRGDLAYREDQWYKKVPDLYFYNAVNYVNEQFPNVRLFLFSDEPEWVKEVLCPNLTAPYHIIRGNKAFEDLYLISLCDVVIASQGSFGTWGARLNGHSTLIRPSDKSESGFVQVQLFL